MQPKNNLQHTTVCSEQLIYTSQEKVTQLLVVMVETFRRSGLWLKAPSPTVRAWRRCIYIFINNDWVNQRVTEVFGEQPLALPGSAKHIHYSVSHPLLTILLNIILPKLLELGTCNFETIITTPCVSCVTWHHFSQTVRARNLKFWDNVQLPLFATCQVSCVRCQL